MVRRATTFAPELIAVSITASGLHLSLPLSLSISRLCLSRTHTAVLGCIELPTTAVTHDVVDTLNQRWRPRRIRKLSLPPSFSPPNGYIPYDAMERYSGPSSVSRWNTHRRIALHRGANNDVPRLFGLLTVRGATFDRRARSPREKIIRIPSLQGAANP